VISFSASLRPTHDAPSTDLPGSRSLQVSKKCWISVFLAGDAATVAYGICLTQFEQLATVLTGLSPVNARCPTTARGGQPAGWGAGCRLLTQARHSHGAHLGVLRPLLPQPPALRMPKDSD